MVRMEVGMVMVMVMVMVFVVVMVMVMVIEDMCHFCFIWCESNIVENSLVPIWPDVAEFVFLTKLVMTKKSPPKVVELVRVANSKI